MGLFRYIKIMVCIESVSGENLIYSVENAIIYIQSGYCRVDSTYLYLSPGYNNGQLYSYDSYQSYEYSFKSDYLYLLKIPKVEYYDTSGVNSIVDVNVYYEHRSTTVSGNMTTYKLRPLTWYISNLEDKQLDVKRTTEGFLNMRYFNVTVTNPDKTQTKYELDNGGIAYNCQPPL